MDLCSSPNQDNPLIRKIMVPDNVKTAATLACNGRIFDCAVSLPLPTTLSLWFPELFGYIPNPKGNRNNGREDDSGNSLVVVGLQLLRRSRRKERAVGPGTTRLSPGSLQRWHRGHASTGSEGVWSPQRGRSDPRCGSRDHPPSGARCSGCEISTAYAGTWPCVKENTCRAENARLVP